ncbi:hypothetical protein [uncultured Pantoea sp.]|uniref:hypothetical protein n=1 Tax=uncultured Pantoea sp. TaxID=218084 RepID=UPI00258C1D92|nr:hypothetical protein [uncultured Pantoea sp.]
MRWIAKQSEEFRRDELRRKISKVNWGYHKPLIKRALQEVVKIATENNIHLFVYDYDENQNRWGFDGLNLQFGNEFTGNMIQTEIEEEVEIPTENGTKKITEKYINFDHHKQEGAMLVITYSAVGHTHIFVSPSISKDSLAEHKNLILYHTYDARTITKKVLNRCVKALFHYQRFTGVLHRVTWRDRWAIRWLNKKMYFIE